jgi:hypothetical protein
MWVLPLFFYTSSVLAATGLLGTSSAVLFSYTVYQYRTQDDPAV